MCVCVTVCMTDIYIVYLSACLSASLSLCASTPMYVGRRGCGERGRRGMKGRGNGAGVGNGGTGSEGGGSMVCLCPRAVDSQTDAVFWAGRGRRFQSAKKPGASHIAPPYLPLFFTSTLASHTSSAFSHLHGIVERIQRLLRSHLVKFVTACSACVKQSEFEGRESALATRVRICVYYYYYYCYRRKRKKRFTRKR